MKKILILLCLPMIGFGQQTYVPDDNFEQALINLGYDTILDDSVLTANINTVTQLSIYNQNISVLTGIEDFTALTNLSCGGNQLVSLDVSNNTALTYLSCSHNQLTSIDVSNNTALTELYCWNNQLTSLDLSNNTALTTLHCDDNQLTSLDVSNNTALTYLLCYNNQLTSLDLSNNTAVTNLYCNDNQLTSLDLSNNVVLSRLYCNNNPYLFCIEASIGLGLISNQFFLNMDSWTTISSNCNPIYGCTDSLACNYDILANTNYGFCILPDGCTDATACNYDATATCDDGSCIGVSGCTDATSYNYNSSATCDDGSCAFIPQGINYQAVARDATGDVLMNQSLDVKLSIISDITTGNISWQETHSATTNDYGLFTAIIGGGTTTGSGTSTTFDDVDWGASNHLLKVEIDYDGSGYVDMGTTAFMSVPYALYSANSGSDGAQGPQGPPGPAGTDGNDGTPGTPGTDGTNGVDGVGIAQTLTISGDTIFISNGNYVIIPGLIPIASVQIGDYRDGGIVFWVDTTGQHGLICDIQDLGTAEWGCYGTVIVGANGTAIGTGQQNTNDILVGCNQSSGIAAEICNNSIAQGFSDWFLPSKDELSQMYQNKAIIEASAISNGGSAFATYYYWSSSEFDFYNAWEQYFSDGYQSINYKFSTYNIRAVRVF